MMLIWRLEIDWSYKEHTAQHDGQPILQWDIDRSHKEIEILGS